MFNRKKLIALGTSGVAALALVGVGTGAQWADQVDAIENIETGTVDVQIFGYHNVYAGNDTPKSVVISPDKQSITFTVPLEDASFAYTQDVYIRNAGSLDLKRAWYTVSTSGDPELLDNVYMRVNDVYDASDNTWVGHPSQLSGHESTGYAMPAGATTTLWFDFYTGDRTATDAVPAFASNGQFLPDAAQGKTMQVTVTFHGLDGDGGNAMSSTPETRS